MARRFRSNFRARGPVRLTEWVGGVVSTFDVSALAAGTSTLVSSLDFRLLPSLTPSTIVRIRGLLTVGTQAGTAGLNPHGAFGIQLVSGEAFDAGVASMATPFSESESGDWLFHTFWAVMQQDVDAGAVYKEYVIDSRAMRKVTNLDVLATIIENGSSTDSAQFLTNKRTLLKLA